MSKLLKASESLLRSIIRTPSFNNGNRCFQIPASAFQKFENAVKAEQFKSTDDESDLKENHISLSSDEESDDDIYDNMPGVPFGFG